MRSDFLLSSCSHTEHGSPADWASSMAQYSLLIAWERRDWQHGAPYGNHKVLIEDIFPYQH